jgi:hypothetical protein
MDCICSICGRKKYKPPFSDKREVIDMCPDCTGIQDTFLERRLGEAKDTKERRRKEDKHKGDKPNV